MNDDVVIDLVKKEISDCERKNRSFIVSGFPRTKYQALSMQKLGIIPDKFILFTQSEQNILSKIKKNISTNDPKIFASELNTMAAKALQEY